MQISVELSCYPLAEEFIPVIKSFIDKINQHSEITAITNTMSTQLFGEFDDVMKVVTEIIGYSFNTYGKQVFVAKYLNSDVEPEQIS